MILATHDDPETAAEFALVDLMEYLEIQPMELTDDPA